MSTGDISRLKLLSSIWGSWSTGWLLSHSYVHKAPIFIFIYITECSSNMYVGHAHLLTPWSLKMGDWWLLTGNNTTVMHCHYSAYGVTAVPPRVALVNSSDSVPCGDVNVTLVNRVPKMSGRIPYCLYICGFQSVTFSRDPRLSPLLYSALFTTSH